MADEATARIPPTPLSRGKLGKNKNTAPRRPYLRRGPHRTRALSHLEPRRPVGQGEVRAAAAARRGVAGSTGSLIVRGNGPEVINRAASSLSAAATDVRRFCFAAIGK